MKHGLLREAVGWILLGIGIVLIVAGIATIINLLI